MIIRDSDILQELNCPTFFGMFTRDSDILQELKCPTFLECLQETVISNKN